ncbi:cupin domain-containing protein [Nodosilinea sp. LEGE 06152]|uniref:cupin domain-containing protein n=1 Tax=Nodosilinea sp. LEGE 06152 TaxID=2777966 RepID=UPI00188195EA|nr:cupin domain-containing protein [Nodosilinea sp. LEGE 06152]MBE9155807.1 cupin domain-containing protein [Nodosilinea sp. LEGE 06152]
MSLPLILQPGEGQTVQIRTSTCTFKATGQETHGHFGLFEFVMEPGTDGASPHIHKELTEAFYVVEGNVELVLGDRRIVAEPKTFILVPENTPHGFSNAGQTPATLLILFCPADSREQYFEGLAELTKDGREPTQAELLDLMQQFDQYPATNTDS